MVENQEAKLNFLKHHKKLVLAVVLVLIFGIGGNYYIKQSTEPKLQPTTSLLDSLTDEETINTSGPVAIVNGEEITRTAYQNRLKKITNELIKQRYNTSNAKIATQVRQQAVAELVNFELLYQTASAAGVTATESEVGERYQAVLEDLGSEEVLLLVLKDSDLTTAEFKTELAEQIVTEKYLEKTVGISQVTMKTGEVEAYYETIKANNPDLPELSKVKDELTLELIQQKQQQLVTDLIQDLRENAEIEILI